MNWPRSVNDGLFKAYDGLTVPKTTNAKIARSVKQLTLAFKALRHGRKPRARPYEIENRMLNLRGLVKVRAMLSPILRDDMRDCFVEYFAWRGYGDSSRGQAEQALFLNGGWTVASVETDGVWKLYDGTDEYLNQYLPFVKLKTSQIASGKCSVDAAVFITRAAFEDYVLAFSPYVRLNIPDPLPDSAWSL